MTEVRLTYSCTANCSEEGGFDQDFYTEDNIKQQIMNHYDVENNIQTSNDQGIDCDDIETVQSIRVEIDCMADPASVEYTVYADVKLVKYSEENSY